MEDYYKKKLAIFVFVFKTRDINAMQIINIILIESDRALINTSKMLITIRKSTFFFAN